MADVTGVSPHHDDRGQLILVTAVGIAALLILLAMILNSVIFTENLATRGGQTEHAGEAMDYRVETERAVTDLMERSNREGWSYADFRENVTTWNDLSARHVATNGATTNVSVTGTTYWTRIVQDESARNLSSATGATKWDLIGPGEDAHVHKWEMNVSRTSLAVETASASKSDLVNAGAFRIEMAGVSGSTWDVFVYQDGTRDVLVRVDDGSGLSTPCQVAETPSGTVVIDLVAAKVGGNDCTVLGSLDVTSTDRLTFNESQRVEGTYSLIVDRPMSTVDDGDFASDRTSPYVTLYIADVTVDITYTTPRMRYYAKDVLLVPEERR